jgi:hypothetical protein
MQAPAAHALAASALAVAAAAAPGESPSAEPPSGVCLFSSGAGCAVESVEAWEVGSCWRGPGGEGGAEEGAAGAAAVVRPAFLHHLHIS